MTTMLKRLLAMLHDEPGDKGGGGGDGGDNGGKTAEQIAADKAAADKATTDAAAARVETEKGWKPEQIAAADAAAKAATEAGKTPAEIAAARDDAAKAAVDSQTGGGAPAKYELVLPEGSEHTAEDVTAFEAWARALGLTNEQAQQAIDDQVTAIEDRLEQFKKETEADPDYGGEKLAETQRLANVILDRVRPEGHARRDGLMRILMNTGYINNIEIVSFLADLGKLAGEDPGAGGSGGGKGEKAPLKDRMFPSSAAKA